MFLLEADDLCTRTLSVRPAKQATLLLAKGHNHLRHVLYPDMCAPPRALEKNFCRAWCAGSPRPPTRPVPRLVPTMRSTILM